VRTSGDPRRVIDAYLLDVAETEGRACAAVHQPTTVGVASDADPVDMTRALEGRWGSREVEIVSVRLLGASGEAVQLVRSGDPIEIRLYARAREPVSDLVFGVGVFNSEGVCCYGTNTQIDGAVSAEMRGDGEVRFAIHRLDLVEGTYRIDVAAHRGDGTPYDYHRQLYTLRVASLKKDTGIFRPPHEWTFAAEDDGTHAGHT
jgi:hypothetical protein